MTEVGMDRNLRGMITILKNELTGIGNRMDRGDREEECSILSHSDSHMKSRTLPFDGGCRIGK